VENTPAARQNINEQYEGKQWFRPRRSRRRSRRTRTRTTTLLPAVVLTRPQILAEIRALVKDLQVQVGSCV
jgi:hypothetical protein